MLLSCGLAYPFLLADGRRQCVQTYVPKVAVGTTCAYLQADINFLAEVKAALARKS